MIRGYIGANRLPRESALACGCRGERGDPGLSVRGLMAIPPNIEDTVQKEGYFEQMYRRFIDMKAKKLDNVSMTILSMGMSHDYPLAIRHGSNVVRIGRALFGERM